MPKNRDAALDFSRFLAAAVVFLGHLLFLPNTHEWSIGTVKFLDPIRTGETAVLFFFALSGYVLALSERNTRYLNWLFRRLLRLFPVYVSAWSLGLLILTLRNKSLPSLEVILFGLTGTSAFSPKFNLVGNPPLWSLSVEIIYAFILFYILKVKNRSLLALGMIALGVIAWFFLTEAPILRALAYFCAGVLLRNEKIVNLRINKKLVKFVLTSGFVVYIAIGATWLVNVPDSIRSEFITIGFVSCLIILASQISITGVAGKVSVAAGKRSFCLYAFHYPVLLVVNYFIRPNNSSSMVMYVFLSISITIVLTEFTFRLIDAPSTKWAAQKFRE